MNTPQLSASQSANGLECVLRVDQIRRDTLIQLAQAWADGGRADIEDALDHLAEVVQSPREEGELDAAVEAVDEAACMEYPQIHMDRSATNRLRSQLTTVLARWSGPRAWGNSTQRAIPAVPQPRQGGEAA